MVVVVEQLRPIVQIMGLVQKLYVPNHVARANEAKEKTGKWGKEIKRKFMKHKYLVDHSSCSSALQNLAF